MRRIYLGYHRSVCVPLKIHLDIKKVLHCYTPNYLSTKYFDFVYISKKRAHTAIISFMNLFFHSSKSPLNFVSL